MSKISEIFEKSYRNLKNRNFRKLLKDAGIKYLEFGQEMSVRFEEDVEKP